MGKITDIQIRHWLKAGVPVAKAQGDVPGLTFTLSTKGTAAWVLRYRIAGKQKELTIGRYPEYTIASAKTAAMEARAKIMTGVDVAREKRQGQIHRAGEKTLAELARDFMDKSFPGLAENTRRQRRHHIEDVIIPRLGSIPANAVNGSDVVDLLERVGRDSVHVAGLVRIALSEIFKHGVARRVVVSNPCTGIAVSAVCGPAPPKRHRLKLTESELRVLLPALDGGMSEAAALAVRVLLATCVRVSELMQAEWVDVHLDQATWIIPAPNAKSGKGVTIPLAPVVVEWFERLKVLSCGSRFVLPSTKANTHRTPDSIVRAINALTAKLPEVRRFTPHDCRSTARSHLAALGVPVLVAERCLNHALGGLVAIYDQHDYLDERRKALQLWADFLSCCESGLEWMPADNVVPIRAAV